MSDFFSERYVIFTVDRHGVEHFLQSLSNSGIPKGTRIAAHAMPFYSARQAYEWASNVKNLAEWQVGRREAAGLQFGKHKLKDLALLDPSETKLQ